jgi:cysteine-rich repeat protein
MNWSRWLTAGVALHLASCDETPSEPDDPGVVDGELPWSDYAEFDTEHAQLPAPPADECAHRWDVGAAAEAAGNAANIPYEYSYSCVGRAQPGTTALGDFLNATFPDGTAGYGTYRCQQLTPPYYSLHAEGRAIDFMIRTDAGQYGGANNAVGDPIADWLIENAEAIGIQSIIWDRTIWRSSYWPRDHCVDISNPHWDHLHIELTWDGAMGDTPWFNGGGVSPLPGAGGGPGAEPDPWVDPAGTFIIDSNNAVNTWAWGADPSPSWVGSTGASGYWNSGYYAAPTAFLGLDFMDFWFLRGEPGCLATWGWWPAHWSHSPDTFMIAYGEPNGHIRGWDAGLVEHGRATVDQTTGGNQWNYLGSWNFTHTWNKISVNRWTNSLVGNAVADAVRLMPSGLCAANLSPGQIIIDDHNNNNDTSRYYSYFPNTWNYKGWVVPSWAFGAWQAPTSFWGLDFADYQFRVDSNTCYDVDAWWGAQPGNAPDTYMIGYHEPSGAVQGWNTEIVEVGRTTVNQRENGSKWNRLGTWYFPAGWNKVVVNRWTESLQGWAVADAIRLTPSTGCVIPCADSDGDGTTDCNETCPSDPAKTSPGTCGCGVADTDTDGDWTANCQDACPSDPAKIAGGVCGCGTADTNADGDPWLDCQDACPTDAGKGAPGVCGCGVSDVDTDRDGQADCVETCDLDPGKAQPGFCGCGTADTDTDNDGSADCVETCDSDPAKRDPGVCGCGNPDRDRSGDGVIDCGVCGDGVRQDPEVCDDRNTRAGDGCSATCTWERPRLATPAPGRAGASNTLVATQVAPGHDVLFLSSRKQGSSPMAGCPGLRIPLDAPHAIGVVRAGPRGQATANLPVSARDVGKRDGFVVVDRDTCKVSAPVWHTWR